MTHRIGTRPIYAASGNYSHFSVLLTCPALTRYRLRQLRVWTNGSAASGFALGIDTGGASPAVDLLAGKLDGVWRSWDKLGDWYMEAGDRLYFNVAATNVFASLRVSAMTYPV